MVFLCRYSSYVATTPQLSQLSLAFLCGFHMLLSITLMQTPSADSDFDFRPWSLFLHVVSPFSYSKQDSPRLSCYKFVTVVEVHPMHDSVPIWNLDPFLPGLLSSLHDDGFNFSSPLEWPTIEFHASWLALLAERAPP